MVLSMLRGALRHLRTFRRQKDDEVLGFFDEFDGEIIENEKRRC